MKADDLKSGAFAFLAILLLTICGCARDSNREVLEGNDLDAMDAAIALHFLNDTFTSQPIKLSPGLKKRLSKYNGKVQFELQVKDCVSPLLEDGAKIIITSGCQFQAELHGALNAKIQITSGQVGLIKGEVFVSDDTLATVNGKHYKYEKGYWLEVPGTAAATDSKAAPGSGKVDQH